MLKLLAGYNDKRVQKIYELLLTNMISKNRSKQLYLHMDSWCWDNDGDYRRYPKDVQNEN
eukprot:UN10058